MVAKLARRGRKAVVALVALLVVGLIVANAWLRQHPEVWLELQLLVRTPSDTDTGRIDPELARRLADAQQGARQAGMKLVIVTAYRPWDTQLAWYRNGLAKYGSEAEARRHVLPPWESKHVRGLAVDVAENDASRWLAASNGRFGLCQRYANEPWHFEMLGDVGQECPAMEVDASEGNP